MDMIIDEYMKVKWNPKNKKHYEEMGYVFTAWGEEFNVKVKDLTIGCRSIVKVKCGCCDKINNITYKHYRMVYDKRCTY